MPSFKEVLWITFPAISYWKLHRQVIVQFLFSIVASSKCRVVELLMLHIHCIFASIL